MYNVTIKNEQGNVILGSTGDFRVLAYTATAAKRVLAGLDDGAEVSVKATEVNEQGETTNPIVSFSGDRDIAALVLSSKVSKLRATLKAAGKETDESESEPATDELADGGPANTEAQAEAEETLAEETPATGRRSRR